MLAPPEANYHVPSCTLLCTREFDHLLTQTARLHLCGCGRAWIDGGQMTTAYPNHPPIPPADMDPGYPPNSVSMDWIGGGPMQLEDKPGPFGRLLMRWRRWRGLCEKHGIKLGGLVGGECERCIAIARLDVPRGTETLIPPFGGSNVRPPDVVPTRHETEEPRPVRVIRDIDGEQ